MVFSDIITAHFVSIISDHNSFVTSFAAENDIHNVLMMEMMSENSGFAFATKILEKTIGFLLPNRRPPQQRHTTSLEKEMRKR